MPSARMVWWNWCHWKLRILIVFSLDSYLENEAGHAFISSVIIRALETDSKCSSNCILLHFFPSFIWVNYTTRNTQIANYPLTKSVRCPMNWEIKTATKYQDLHRTFNDSNCIFCICYYPLLTAMVHIFILILTIADIPTQHNLICTRHTQKISIKVNKITPSRWTRMRCNTQQIAHENTSAVTWNVMRSCWQWQLARVFQTANNTNRE